MRRKPKTELLPALFRLSETLKETEIKIIKSAKKLNRQLKRKLAKAEISDYELELNVEYYRKCDDDAIHELKHISMRNATEAIVHMDEDNLNSFEHIKDHPMREWHHCYLFHDLYDHSKIKCSWEKIASIDTIWWELQAWYQHQIIIDTECGDKVKSNMWNTNAICPNIVKLTKRQN